MKKNTNKFVQNLVVGDPTTFFNKLIYYTNDNENTKIIQYCIMHGMVLCIKVLSYVTHMFYVCSFSHNTEVPIAIKKNKYFPP